jgi:hypothetical protein
LYILRSTGEAPENREFLVSWLGGVDCKHLESNSGPIAECAMWYGDVGKVTQCQKRMNNEIPVVFELSLQPRKSIKSLDSASSNVAHLHGVCGLLGDPI